MEDKEGLSDEQIADNIIGVIFAARDTTASVMTWILKYLADNPTVLEAVTVSTYFSKGHVKISHKRSGSLVN